MHIHKILILIISNKEDLTADFLIAELERKGASYLRVNTEDFPQNTILDWHIDASFMKGSLRGDFGNINLSDIDSVWYRRPKSPQHQPGSFSREAAHFMVRESNAALQGFWNSMDCFWVSNPEMIWRAESKPYQLKVASEIGFPIPPTLITNDPVKAEEFIDSHCNDVIYKTLRGGRVKTTTGRQIIFTSPLGDKIIKNLDSIRLAPCLLQKRYSKEADLRVTVIGQHVFAVKIESQLISHAKEDWRRVDVRDLRHSRYQLPNTLAEKCLNLVKALSLQFGAIDMILTPRGDYVFLEINPNGQWAWIEQLCPDIPMRESFINLLKRPDQHGI